MDRAEKRQIRLRILNIQDNQCKGCRKVPKKLSQDKRNKYCRQNCEIGKTLEKLGDSLIEGRTSSMAEQKNWDQICATAEKLRAADKKKWTWGRIAEHLGVTEGNLYYHISRRREANSASEKRVGASKKLHDTKTLPKRQNAEKTKSEPLQLNSVASSHISKPETIDSSWQETMATIIDEKDALAKELSEISKQYSELKDLKEKLAQDFIAETKARLEAEDSFERMKQQLRDFEEDYNVLKNEFNALNEKKFELEYQLRRMNDNLRLAEKIASEEREHRIELQGRSQALSMALKAVL
ncbi:zinc-finger domain-containing protein [Bacillus cytotoxicus]|nr:zinc-finger domain-containing protein [Bacillus cytotoxicus]